MHRRVVEPWGRVVVGVGVFVTGAAAWEYSKVPVPLLPERKNRHVLVPLRIETAIGSIVYNQLRSSATILPDQDDRVKIVKHVFQRLLVGSGKELQSLGWNWEVTVIENPQFNAFCVPGGKVVVFTGLLDTLLDIWKNDAKRVEASLAFVLGHEIGHAIARKFVVALF
jgi:predicted Zn-dependent protease